MRLFLQPSKLINGRNIKAFIIGDPAYPLQDWLMKGYTAPKTPEEESFNVYLSKARIVVENAFGRLKSRWRILQKRIDADIEMVPYIVATCCVLHNIAEINKIPLRASWTDTQNQNRQNFPQPNSSASYSEILSANQIRDHLKDYFTQNFPTLQSRIH